MFCPVCGVEYRAGFERCSDCDVALVPELAQTNSAEVEEGPSGATLVWYGNEERRYAQALSTLERAGIPAFTTNNEDRLFGTTEKPKFELFVAQEFAERAKQELEEHAVAAEEWSQLQESGALELPDEEVQEQEFPDERGDWHSDDATAEIWSGDDRDIAEMIVASLSENGIECKRERASGDEGGAVKSTQEKLFVLPEDQERSHEIVREIIDAAPL